MSPFLPQIVFREMRHACRLLTCLGFPEALFHPFLASRHPPHEQSVYWGSGLSRSTSESPSIGITGLYPPSAEDLVIKAVDCQAITLSQIPSVLKEWREPAYEEFRPRNAWSLFNAATEFMKGTNPNVVKNLTRSLLGPFDGLIGLN